MVAKVLDPTDQTPDPPDPPEQTLDLSSSSDPSPSTSSVPSPYLPPIDTHSITNSFSHLTLGDDNMSTLPTIIELDTTSKPAKYDGTRDGFKCLAWLKEVKRYFSMKGVPEDKRTIHAINLLNHSSLLWWDSLNHDDSTDYNTFVKEFKKAYMPDGFLEQVRGLLLNAKLTSNLAEYLTRLRLYMNLLIAEDVTGRAFLEATAQVVFHQGCPDDLQQLLRSDKVSNPDITFSDMCSKAEGFDNIYAFGPNGATKGMFARIMHNTRAHTPTSNPAPPPPTFDPMAMEIDNINIDPNTRALMSTIQSCTVAMNAMANQFNRSQQQQQQQQQQQRPPLARLTEEERAYLRANDGCFKCRRTNAGHKSYDCKVPSRSIHNIANAGSSTTPQSGNAPSN